MFKNSLLKNKKGQVAVFIVLVFNVLFIFFAMVINVGLLIHHKINLQNSVDLAAYYGASKQSEVLNAISHINYQIRQSWKLLSYRYVTLGSIGFPQHPYSAQATNDLDVKYEYDPLYCITYQPMWADNANENTCKHVQSGMKITRIGIPNLIAPFLPFNRQIIDAARAADRQMAKRCEQMGAFNYINLARQYYGFIRDQANRKRLLYFLANNLSLKEDEFFDIEGKSAKEGIEKTLKKNLTAANNESFIEMKVINSLQKCGAGANDIEAPKWLSEIKVLPGFIYVDWNCGNREAYIPVQKSLTELPNNNAGFDELIQKLGQFTNLKLEGIYTPSIGVEKNPWCMAYVGVEAKTKPKIPFTPFGAVELTAKAYAKPFGASIGPWYAEQWPNGADRSTGQKISDLFPPRQDTSGEIGDPNDPSRLANFSRFVGDILGLRSRLSHYWLGRGLREPNEIRAKFAHYNHLLNSIDDKNDPGDILAWDSDTNKASPIRDFEVAAVAPDIFDVTYYNIDSNFSNYYLPKIREGFGNMTNFKIRGDLGMRDDQEALSKFSIKDQILTAQKKLNTSEKLTYYVQDIGKLLTSWVTVRVDDYSMNAISESFSKCFKENMEESQIPTGCQKGGRSGYSVKLVSEDYLKSNQLPLGGNGGGSGPILNPP